MKGKTAVYTLLTAAVLTFITTAGAPRVHAIDWATYPGEMCMKWTGAGTPKYYFGGIGNTSPTDWLYLDCPVVLKTESAPSGGAQVIVRDLHPGAAVNCTLYNAYNKVSDGTYYYKTSGPLYSSGSGYSPQVLQLQGLGLTPSTGYNQYTNSVYYYSCAIPPSYSGGNSYILEYLINLE
jgi:hypothetical protein